jgi:hypothetical protein
VDGSFVLRWLLTVAFVLAGVYCTVQCIGVLRAERRGDAATLVGNLAHLAMSTVMAGMVWWAPSWRVATWEIALFAVAGGWFAVRVVAMTQRASVSHAHSALPHGPAHSRLGCAYQATAMATMVWMLTVMAARPGMPGMSPHGAGAPSTRAFVVTALAVYFGIAAAVWIASARRRRRMPGSSAQALMSAAMGTAVVSLAW